MVPVIPVAHDYTCSWCWIGWNQVRRLEREFSVRFDWKPFDLFPEPLDLPIERPPVVARPPTPTRIELAYLASEVPRPSGPRPEIRSGRALRATEYARDHGFIDQMVDKLYQDRWVNDVDINGPEYLSAAVEELGLSGVEMLRAVEAGAYDDRIIAFDEDAHRQGVYHVPTFWIGGTRHAEQPISTIRQALIDAGVEPRKGLYEDLAFPAAFNDRPYTFINMVSTIDGKILTGERDEPVMDLGSSIDHLVMRQIEANADAVMIGAGSLRATPKLYYAKDLTRAVVTASGSLPWESRFFTDAPDKAIVISPRRPALPPGVRWLELADWGATLSSMRQLGIERLLIEGGSEINAELLRRDLVDELFLTVAPKVKLGRDVPTYAGGEPLLREEVMRFELVSEYRRDDEIFLRYRRPR